MPGRPTLWAAAAAGTCLAAAGPAAAQGAASAPGAAALVASYLAAHPDSAETVTFAQAGWPPVRVVRGGGWRPRPARPPSAPAPAAETVAFADPKAPPVVVLRGTGGTPAPAGRAADGFGAETVSFADPGQRPVTVIRGPALAAGLAPAPGAEFNLFAPASAADLDRVAFAVDGAESSHGADPGMWRADPAGPQGPMQVSLAAALDVGGGDRFKPGENRALGRAYLARLYRRYGNWADAVMAYNWGPAHLDAWIAAGRPDEQLPIEVAQYRERVLGEAALAGAERTTPGPRPAPEPAVLAARDGR